MAELADAADLKSASSECGFESHLAHATSLNWEAYSRVAQLAELSTVNRMVPGSSPGTGAYVTYV